jgi:uracil-DNA glycosylase family 4
VPQEWQDDASVGQRKTPLARCEQCPLYEQPGPVHGDGPDGPVKVMVLGEAPGFQETIYGRPFCGPSGKVLDEALHYNDIPRKDVYVTNTVLCRPPDNANPPKEAVAACSERLWDEIRRHEPEYIIATGAVAAKALGYGAAMSKMRVGPPRPERIPYGPSPVDGYLDTRVILTWHPAYCLRVPDALPSMALDIGKVHGVGPADWREPDLFVPRTVERAIAAIQDLMEMPGPFAVDIETGLEKDEVDIHADRQTLLCVGVGYERDKVVVFPRELLADPMIQGQFGTFLRRRPLIFHNGKSDLAGLWSMFGLVNMVYDTMLEHYALDERTGIHSLEQLGIELVGTPPWKEMVKPYLTRGRGKNFADIPPEVLWRYNAIDCSVTWRLHELFWSQLTAQGRTGLLTDILIPAARELVHLEMEGIGFDMDYSERLEAELHERGVQVEHAMRDLLGREVNPRSPKQLLDLLTEHEAFVPVDKRKKTTSAPALKAALKAGKYDDNPVIQDFLELLFLHRKLAKDEGTFVRGMQKVAVEHPWGHRVHTTYTLHVTTTGRLSSKSPNLQNIKDDPALRRQFVAGPGKVLLQGDYSQVEGRVIAALSGDEYLLGLFRNPDRDIFDEITEAMYGRPDPSKRRLVKTFFYGLSYGRTAYGIAEGFGIAHKEAQDQLERFKSLVPGVVAWQEATVRKVLDQGYLETTFGRRRHFPLISDQNYTDVRNEALAFVPQSTASDICLRAFTRLRPALDERFGQDARCRLTIHDAIVVEVNEHWIADVQDLVHQYMTDSGEDWSRALEHHVPFDVAFKSGRSWDKLGD